jgi:hypothetical protein
MRRFPSVAISRYSIVHELHRKLNRLYVNGLELNRGSRSLLMGVLLYFFFDERLSGKVVHVRLLCLLDNINSNPYPEVLDRL